MALIMLTVLMQWNRVSEALHHRVEKAGVASVFHAKSDPLVLEEYLSAFHEVINGVFRHFLEITPEISLVLLTLLPLKLQLPPSFRGNTGGFLRPKIMVNLVPKRLVAPRAPKFVVFFSHSCFNV